MEVDDIDNEQHGDISDIEMQLLYCFRLWKYIFEDCVREIFLLIFVFSNSAILLLHFGSPKNTSALFDVKLLNIFF